MPRFVMPLAVFGCTLFPASGIAAEASPPSRPVQVLFRSLLDVLARSEEHVPAELIRDHVAEAFVIPTGAMAPTLIGRHKALECPQCGWAFRVSASSEVDSTTGGPTHRQIVGATCPMCRFTMDIGPDNPQGKRYRSKNGDRILVSKTSYSTWPEATAKKAGRKRAQAAQESYPRTPEAHPERWDVVVFQYPGGPDTRFVKRIVGLPDETVRISHGDIFVRRPGEEAFAIARKPPEKLRSLLRVVYDNDHVLPENIRRGWPARWRAWPQAQSESAVHWIVSKDDRSFETDGSSHDAVWLRYRHVVPSYEDWEKLMEGALAPEVSPKPQLISDFFAYNTGKSKSTLVGVGTIRNWDLGESTIAPNPEALGLHWVGDLAIECTADVQSGGEITLELVEGGRPMRCRVDLARGAATLSIEGLLSYRPAASTKIRPPGTYRILFANVDDQLLLWVDGRLVRFDVPTTYHSLGNTRPTPADLAPVGIASRGAAVKIRHLRVLRDNYYIALGEASFARPVLTDFRRDANPYGPLTREGVAQFLSDPGRWAAFENTHQDEFSLDADQFFMLGDNSAQSKDGRLWPREGVPHYVRRELLVGKVLYRYFPRVGIVQ